MDKVYTPEVIQETPFPGDLLTVPAAYNNANQNGNYKPTATKETKLPQRKIAKEVISSVLNTKSRKILQEFELQQSGGFKIGNYQEGISGEVSITPNGITAKNIAGLTTIAVDGDTGDAIFAGELRSGSTVTGSVEVTDGYIALYNDGILQIFIGDDGN